MLEKLYVYAVYVFFFLLFVFLLKLKAPSVQDFVRVQQCLAVQLQKCSVLWFSFKTESVI